MIRVIRAAEQIAQPWKNGGGSTTQIVSQPEGATLDAFDWRVSMARVETDGPFSLFPQIDRTLAILDGEGVVLEVEGRAQITVTGAGRPARFPGDRPTHARLIGGPVTDLNVMSRRGRFRHRLARIVVDGATVVSVDADTLVALSLGEVRLGLDAEHRTLNVRDAAIITDARDRSVSLTAALPTIVWLAEIEALDPSDVAQSL